MSVCVFYLIFLFSCGTSSIDSLVKNPKNSFSQLLVEITDADEPEILEDAAFALNCVINKKPTKADEQRIKSVTKFKIGECHDPYFFVALGNFVPTLELILLFHVFKLIINLVQKELGMEVDNDDDKKGPKRARTAYNYFVSDMKREGKAKTIIAEEWNNIEKEKKAYYDKLANQDKIRYKSEMGNTAHAQKLPRRNVQSKRYAIESTFKKILEVFSDFLHSIDSHEEALHACVHLFVTTKFFFAQFRNMIFPFPDIPKSSGNSDILTQSKNNVECYINNIELKITSPDTSANMFIRMACALLRALSFMKQERKEKLLEIEKARIEAEQLREVDRLLHTQLKKRKI